MPPIANGDRCSEIDPAVARCANGRLAHSRVPFRAALRKMIHCTCMAKKRQSLKPASPEQPGSPIPPSADPPTLPMLGFVDRFIEIHRKMKDRAFCFILGAGASKTSQIKMAGEMVAEWITTLHRASRDYGKVEEKKWATAANLGIKEFDPANPAGSYPALYDRVFRDDPGRGYAFLEDQMAASEPSYGYAVLGRILAQTEHKVVITTNFDNLVADSLSIFSETYPLVCGHETLARFAQARPRRPLVIKVHNDLLLEPRSTPVELNGLPDEYASALAKLLDTYTPIVIGYGGNDGRLMGYLNELKPGKIRGGVYWCYREPDGPPPLLIRSFVARQRGELVAIPGFDELMTNIGDRLEYELPDRFIVERAQKRADRIVKQAEDLTRKLKRAAGEAGMAMIESEPEQSASEAVEVSTSPPAAEAVQTLAALKSTMKREESGKRWWQWRDEAEAHTDPEKQIASYRAGLIDHPNSAPLKNWFGVRLDSLAANAKVPTSMWSEVEDLYREAIKIEPKHAAYQTNLAWLLERFARNESGPDPKHRETSALFAEAESLYRVVIESDSKHARSRNNLAWLLDGYARGDAGPDPGKRETAALFIEAEQLYREAIAVDNQIASARNNLAMMLERYARGEAGPDPGRREASALFVEAENLYRASIAIDSKETSSRNNLGLLLDRYARGEAGPDPKGRDREQLDAESFALISAAAKINNRNAAMQVNLAWWFLSRNRFKEGEASLVEARRCLIPNSLGRQHVKVLSLQYFLDPSDVDTLKKLRAILEKTRERATGWRFADLIRRAGDQKHFESEWLERLALVCVGKAPLASLDSWPVWAAAR
jgi:hypothetical protein